MRYLLPLVLLCLALICSGGVWTALEDQKEWRRRLKREFERQDWPPEGPQIQWRQSSEFHWLGVLQCGPGSTHWATGGWFSLRTGPRWWPDSTETILVLQWNRQTGPRASWQVALPFSLPAILTAMALLFHFGCVWTFVSCRRRQRLRRLPKETKEGKN